MKNIPFIRQQGSTRLLMVHDRPLILLAGEVHNSNSSSVAYMEGVWDQAEALGMNALLLPVTWEMTEPEEGVFDFSVADGLIQQARRREKHLVFLWFGAWKNAECMYAPAWVKKDVQRFRRGQIIKGMNKAPRKEMHNVPYTTLSYLCEETCRADAKAFAALMAHIREVDGEENTVVAVQVENETGLLGAARERSDEADAAYAADVPAELSAYLRSHLDTMVPDVRKAVEAGSPAGIWEEQFGPVAEELFSAWHVAKYVEKVAAAGKAEYALPMAVNCWLDKGDKPGIYPSGGPVSRVREVWNCAAPSIDLFCPDIYVPNFCDICDEYTRRGEALFIPECAVHSYAGPRMVWTVGHHHAMCYSPFGFEDMGKPFNAMQSILFGVDVTDPALRTPQDIGEYKRYADLLTGLMPLLTEAYGSKDLQAVTCERPDEGELDFGEFKVDALLDFPLISRKDGVCLGLKTGPDSCILLCSQCGIRFRSGMENKPNVDYLSVEEGTMENGQWKTIRRLNGDETASMMFGEPTLLSVRIFCYD